MPTAVACKQCNMHSVLQAVSVLLNLKHGLVHNHLSFVLHAMQAQLFAADQTCSYCGNKILSLDDAEVDHINPFSKGGLTEDTNAQLLHRYCNRKKSNVVVGTPHATTMLIDHEVEMQQ